MLKRWMLWLGIASLGAIIGRMTAPREPSGPAEVGARRALTSSEPRSLQGVEPLRLAHTRIAELEGELARLESQLDHSAGQPKAGESTADRLSALRLASRNLASAQRALEPGDLRREFPRVWAESGADLVQVGWGFAPSGVSRILREEDAELYVDWQTERGADAIEHGFGESTISQQAKADIRVAIRDWLRNEVELMFAARAKWERADESMSAQLRREYRRQSFWRRNDLIEKIRAIVKVEDPELEYEAIALPY